MNTDVGVFALRLIEADVRAGHKPLSAFSQGDVNTLVTKALMLAGAIKQADDWLTANPDGLKEASEDDPKQ